MPGRVGPAQARRAAPGAGAGLGPADADGAGEGTAGEGTAAEGTAGEGTVGEGAAASWGEGPVADGSGGGGAAGGAGSDGLAETAAAEDLCLPATAAEAAGGWESPSACPDCGLLTGQNASALATAVPTASTQRPALIAGGVPRRRLGTGNKLLISGPPDAVAPLPDAWHRPLNISGHRLASVTF